jgi:hypothetical protein
MVFSSFAMILYSWNILMVNDVCGLIGDRVGHGNCLWWLSQLGCLVVLVPSVSIKDRNDVGLCVVETLQLATYSGKPDISVIPLWERTIAHWEWRDSESSVYPPYWNRVGRWSTVLSGGANPFTFWRIWVKVDICRSRTCKCHVVRDPQLGIIDSNRRCSSVMENRPSDHSS